ncbi:hypothetical protein, partial [Lactobacillus helveticus]|uniref:hypothetical protein n=2 Tax=Lactobacillus helveticus TaxID=1587 RepID=UPI001E62EA18
SLNLIPFSTFVPSFLFEIISNIRLRKKGGTSKKTKKGRIHHGIKIPCFLRQLINKRQSQAAAFLRHCLKLHIFP